MKALSIKQPYASLIAHGIKNIENRNWKTHFRGRIYIHASAKEIGCLSEVLNDKQFSKVCEIWNSDYFPNRNISAIIGEVDIIDCVINHESIWAEKTEIKKCDNCPSEIDGFDICCHYKGKKEGFIPYVEKPTYNWVLANPVLYDKPILNVKGKLSFWEFEESKTCYLFWFENEGKDGFTFEIEAKDHEEALNIAYSTHGPQVYDMMYQIV